MASQSEAVRRAAVLRYICALNLEVRCAFGVREEMGGERKEVFSGLAL